MTRRLVFLLGAGLLLAVGVGARAQQSGQGQQQTFNGPIQQTFGALNLTLEQGASVETDYYPDQTRLVVRTIAQEALITTSARNLLLIENQEGTAEITLPTGRVIKIKPGYSDIVGRSIVDEPGTISIRIASTVSTTVLGAPAALTGEATQPNQLNPATDSRPEGFPVSVSPSTTQRKIFTP